jgi:uncharacterized UPF0160 family protein
MTPKNLAVYTHDTAFHADDVIAVAMLDYAGYTVSLTRTRNADILNEAKANPDAVVLDVGGVYAPDMLNFDHHQDMSLQSAAGLIYTHFKDVICPAEAQPYFAEFISAIDAMDTNRDNIFATWDLLPKGFRNTSSLIGAFNGDMSNPEEQMEQFATAVAFAKLIIGNEIKSGLRKAKSEAEYADRLILPNNVAVFDAFSTVWKRKAEHQFAVLPHANGWQIQSADTSVAVVPESVAACEGFVFRHASGFMAVVKEKAVAVAFAEGI